MRRVLLVLLMTWALPLRAADPSLAAYRADGSRLLWLLHLTDTHIDTFLNGGEEDRLRWALSEGVTTVQPDAVVVTGDATDGTNGIFYSGANQAEWDLYRSIVDTAGLNDAGYYFDLPGNHDAYSDDGLALYRQNSVQGAATGRTQVEWRLDRPWGSTCFVGVATPQEQGKPWPQDPAELTAAELAETEAFLVGNPECRVTLAFGHHDPGQVEGGDAFRALCQAQGIGHYVHGHTHDYSLTFEGGGPLVLRTDSLGQGVGHQVTVLALDHDTFSWETVAADDPWPLVVVTAPVRGRFLAGASGATSDDLELPYAPPVPRGCTAAPVRVLLFDPAPASSATFRLDGGPWLELAQRQDVPAQWRGTFDASALDAGWHALTVRVVGSKERSVEVSVHVVDAPCDVGDEDADGGQTVPPEVTPEVVAEEVAEEVAEVVPEAAVEVVEGADATAGEAPEEAASGDGDAPGAAETAIEARAEPATPEAVEGSGAGVEGSAASDVVVARPDEAFAGEALTAAEVDAGYEGTLTRPDGEGGASGCGVGPATSGASADAAGVLAALLSGLVLARRRYRMCAARASATEP
jgi:hypothetical protein